MKSTIRGSSQVKPESITRAELNGSTAGLAVIRKIIAGTGISITQTGPDDGTGDVTINATGAAQVVPVNTPGITDRYFSAYNSATGVFTQTDITIAGDIRWQLRDTDLTSWAAVSRASGFDVFVAFPTLANLNTLVSDANLVSEARTISTTSPLTGGGDLSANLTLSIADAVANGTTKGAATFTASDFNSADGLIAIDYASGQAASGSTKGFLTAADWTTFNNKGNGTVTAVSIATANGVSGSSSGGATPALTIVLGAITPTTVNGLTFTALATGFTIAGGTTSKTLTVPLDASVSGTNTGDQTITLTGDVTTSAMTNGSFAATIAAQAVTFAKFQNISTNRLLGRSTAGTGSVEQITVGSGLSLSAGTLTASGSGGTVTSVGITGLSGIDVSGSPITTNGDITLSLLDITPDTVNGLKFIELVTGFTIQGGSTNEKLLTVPLDATVSGTNTGDQTITLTGDVTGSGTSSFAATIANSAVTLAKMANVATASVFYRKTAGTGAPEVNTLATLKTDLGLSGTNTGDQNLTAYVLNTRTISTTSPLTGGGDLSANRTFAINDAAADGTTKGAATFTASDFNASSGLISIDYTNGQTANGSTKGFLTAADWTTFNGKQPLNANLTSISAMAFMNVIPYQESPGVWNRVVMGSNMSFAGGVLNTKLFFSGLGTAEDDTAAAATLDLTGLTGSFFDITGNTTITEILLQEGREVTLRFTGTPTITASADIITPGGESITVASGGGFARVLGEAGDVARMSFQDSNDYSRQTFDNIYMRDLGVIGFAPGALTKFYIGDTTSVDPGNYFLIGRNYMAIRDRISGRNASFITDLIVGSSKDFTFPNASGVFSLVDNTETLTNKTINASQLVNATVTLAKLADMATASLFYRKTAGTGVPEVNTLATLKTDLGLTGTNSGDQDLSTYVTLTGAQTLTNKDIDDVDLIGAVNLTGVITPPALTADVNDYAPTGFAGANVIRVSCDDSLDRIITGLAGGVDGRVVILLNVSNNGGVVVLPPQDAGSADENRFDDLGSYSTARIEDGLFAVLQYNGASDKWNVSFTPPPFNGLWVWGNGVGTLTDQPDLVDALALKLNLTGGTMTGQIITSAGSTASNSAGIRLTSGALQTTPQAGAIEFLTDVLYFTKTTAATRTSVVVGPSAGPITFAGPTAARIITVPNAAFTVARTDAANSFTGVQTMTSPALTTPAITGTSTGSGVATAATASTLVLRDGSGDITTNRLIAGAAVRLKGYTVATLPSGTQGDTAYATDLLTPTFLVAAVGGGAVVGPCFYNGSSWVTF